MALIEKLDNAEDTIKDMQAEAAEAKKRLAPPKRKFIDLFLDDNDVNEKAIIGFISFGFMMIFAICDLITAFMGQDLLFSDTIYTSLVVVTLGAFGISEAGSRKVITAKIFKDFENSMNLVWTDIVERNRIFDRMYNKHHEKHRRKLSISNKTSKD